MPKTNPKKRVVYRWVDEETETQHRLIVADGVLIVENKQRGRWGRAYCEVGATARLLVALTTGDPQLVLHGRASAGVVR